MRILTIVQGIYGQRITDNIRHGEVPGWIVESWKLPPVLPPVIDYPEDFLPAALPPADLVIYPCLGGMAVDAAYNDTLMHVSGHILRDEVAGLVKPHKRPPAYLRPGGLSSDDRQG